MSATTGPVQQRTTPQAHALGGSQHTADTLANLNAKISGDDAQGTSEKGAASGYASLSASTKVVEDPANATATPTASKIPIAGGTGKLASGWISEVLAYADLTDDPYADHSARHENSGADEISVAGLSGLLADSQNPLSHALGTAHSADTLANLNAKITGGSLDFSTASRPPSGTASGDLSGSFPGPTVAKIRGYAVQDHAPLDGEVLKWVNANSQYEPASPGGAPEAHTLGGASHTEDTLANLNSKVTGGSLDFSTASRPPTSHALGTAHSSDTLANLNAKISDATLDTNTNPRPPTGSIVAGDLTGSYPSPGVGKIRGYAVQSGAPAAKDILQWSGTYWDHVSGLAPNYDSGWYGVITTNTRYTFTHGLGVIPRHMEVYWASSASPSTIYLMGYRWSFEYGDGRGIILEATSTYIYARTGNNTCIDTYGMGGTRVNSGAGYMKVLAWK